MERIGTPESHDMEGIGTPESHDLEGEPNTSSNIVYIDISTAYPGNSCPYRKRNPVEYIT
ncbi:unnamed protein product, partial [Staurois parvus]